MSLLVTIAARDGGRITGLVALLASMSFSAAIAASVSASRRAVLGEMTH